LRTGSSAQSPGRIDSVGMDRDGVMDGIGGMADMDGALMTRGTIGIGGGDAS
jgi:hypothetical protein